MKKVLLSLSLSLLAAGGAMAQLPAGSVAPDFTLRDLSGNTYNLYTLLNAGKTVYLDVSAAWCAPCWAYHNERHLEALYAKHGPSGAPGVNANTTNDVMVLFIEGESTNTTAQLYGTSTGTTHANYTQGNWVTGTPYPIIDTNAATTSAFDASYQIGYFPTIYMICRDHLIQEVGQVDSNALYAASQATCPTYAPSTTVDAKAITYNGASYFICNAAPTVKFQNYSATQSITAATIKVYAGSTVVSTYNWTGNLALYAVATVTLPSFAGTTFMPYKYDVTVTNDSRVTNNASKDSVFKIYTASTTQSIPWSEGFATANVEPIKMAFSGDYTTVTNSFLANNGSTLQVIGNNGQQTTAAFFEDYYSGVGAVDEIVLGNFNTASATNVALDFDYAYRPYSAQYTDKVEVLVSNDCGATWHAVWSKSGTALYTGTALTSFYYPTAASDWVHTSALMTQYKNANMIVKVKSTSGNGNNVWMDNFKITNSLAVANVITNNSVSIAPNPARDNAILKFNLSQSSDITVQVLDATGRVVATPLNGALNAGQQQVSINTASISAGLYNVVIRTGEAIFIQHLSVVK